MQCASSTTNSDGRGDRELVEHVRVGELLRRQEDELQRVLGQLGERRVALGRRHGRVQLRGAAGRALAQVLDLLALERDQRRDDDRRARQAAARRSGRSPTCPIPVDITTSVSRPASTASIASRWPGRSAREAERLARDAVDPVRVGHARAGSPGAGGARERRGGTGTRAPAPYGCAP